ncbi:MAG TPA: Uma2 family endonuclease [Chromatiaceae bacterium]|nr:Uma2 family endonuclease [Chromatiaceae bacterium]
MASFRNNAQGREEWPQWPKIHGRRVCYPDIMVACDRQPPSDYYENQPLLIVEVLSPSTETRDKLEKLAAYTSLPSLREYFTIAQERIEIDRYSVSNGETTLTRYTEGDDVPFASIDLTLPAASLYAGVE